MAAAKITPLAALPAGITLPNGLRAALEYLRSHNIPWFDDNPYSWEGLPDLGTTSEWDVVTLAGVPFLLWDDLEGRLGTQLDVAPRPGHGGNTLSEHGEKNTPVNIKVAIASPVDLANIAILMPVMLAASKKGNPIIVGHPNLTMFQIDTEAKAGNGPGQLYLFEFDFIRGARHGEVPYIELRFHPFKTKPPGGAGTDGFKPPTIPAVTPVAATPPPPVLLPNGQLYYASPPGSGGLGMVINAMQSVPPPSKTPPSPP